MDISIRTIKSEEIKYTYSQSHQLNAQTGCVGHLRGDMDSDGEAFYTSWDNANKELKTKAFKDELDEVIKALRTDEKFDYMFRSRTSLAKFCYKNTKAEFDGSYTKEYGFRVDTEKYSYLMRLNPNKGDYNFYIYAYIKESLDNHIENASKGIRFITSDYKEKFRIEDGERILVTDKNGYMKSFSCRYIDDTHFETHNSYGDNVYHICEFADRMAYSECKVVPLRSSLPDRCYTVVPKTSELAIIRKGMLGYVTCEISNEDGKSTSEVAKEMNKKLGITQKQEAAMLAGSHFGFETPSADPKNYDEEGIPLIVRRFSQKRGEAR